MGKRRKQPSTEGTEGGGQGRQNPKCVLVELDGVVSRLCYATFWLISYYSCLSSVIHITELTDMNNENLVKLAGEGMKEPDKEDQDSYESD